MCFDECGNVVGWVGCCVVWFWVVVEYWVDYGVGCVGACVYYVGYGVGIGVEKGFDLGMYGECFWIIYIFIEYCLIFCLLIV